MKNFPPVLNFIPFIISGSLLMGCSARKQAPPENDIKALDLKQGKVVLCGPSNKQLGEVHFPTSCNENLKPEMDLAIALLHSFEYDESEKLFAKIIQQAPDCAMAYWGVAMANYHQVWPSPPTAAEIEKGRKAIMIAKSIPSSKMETEYINAIAEFYQGWKLTEHWVQSKKYKDAMSAMYKKYPADKEVAIFYALALVASADPADKSYIQQRTAGNVLMELYKKEPDHPGIVHYIIHSYDYPELASLALPAAQKYASIAPSSSHALHMPSHIFTRLGLWDECIESNLASIEAAKCYAENAGIKGHWDEELHGMDYVVYAYLQKG
jgi:tetratricopeptide (TPR) repeat protein